MMVPQSWLRRRPILRRLAIRSLRVFASVLIVGLAIHVSAPSATAACAGDCDGSAEVTVNELIIMVNIALETAQVSACTAGDADGSGGITINEIIAAVNLALSSCPTAESPTPTNSGPTPTPTASYSPTRTRTSTETSTSTRTATLNPTQTNTSTPRLAQTNTPTITPTLTRTPTETPNTTTTQDIGPSGGTLQLPGARVVVGSGALSTVQALTLTQSSDPEPTGYDTYSPVYRLSPQVLMFGIPVTLTLAFDGDPNLATIFCSRSAGSGYERVGGAVSNGRITAPISPTASFRGWIPQVCESAAVSHDPES